MLKAFAVRKLVAAFIIGSAFLPSSGTSQSCDVVSQWRQWEKTLTSNPNLVGNGGGPYRDYIIRVTFSSSSTGESFTQDAFWDNDPAAPTSFKIRAALRPGSWTWGNMQCVKTDGTACPSVTWSPASGCITVQTNQSSGIGIYDNGFLKQYRITDGGSTTYSFSSLFYANDTKFFWLGDTVWAAPPREIKGQTAMWSSYLQARQGMFTVLQVAPAVTWQPEKNPPEFTALPLAPGFSFDQTNQTNCSPTDPLPNSCSRPIKAYWDKFDDMIRQANEQGFVVLVAGLIDPIDQGSDQKRYPKVQDMKNFARFLAARLAGREVLFSPGFDDRVGSLTADGQTVSSAMEQVGQAIKAAAPRHLVTNHLAGSSLCSAYETFRRQDVPGQPLWMTFFAFQSGHGGGVSSAEGTLCGGPYPSESGAPQVTATRRSIQIPATLDSSSKLPALASFNAEGPYDTYPPPNPPLPVDNRYRVRQVAHNSSLSNAMGFTYGVTQLGIWDNPTLAMFSMASATQDMASLRLRFKDRAPNLHSWPSWILNQQSAFDQKIVLASDGSSLVMAYVPSPNSSIVISTTGLPGLGCTGWTGTWLNPSNNAPTAAPCTPGANRITFTRPSCSSGTPECDWVLEVKKGSSLSASSPVSTKQRLDIRTDLRPTDGTSALYGTFSDSETQIPLGEFLISPPGLAFQQNPQVAALGESYLVVWQATGLDGGLTGIFAQQVGRDGELIGPRLQVNTTTEENQRDPVVASDTQENAVVVWSSYGQDGDRGGIFGQLIDTFGHLVGSEFAVNQTTGGHQEKPQAVHLPGGLFVVAWQTRSEEENPGMVSFRIFNTAAIPLTPEITVPGRIGKLLRLVNLTEEPGGGFKLFWALDDPAGGPTDLYAQSRSSAGVVSVKTVKLNGN